MFTRPFAVLMNFAMATEADRQTVVEIIESFTLAAVFVMHFGRELAAELALEMLPQEREPQPAIFPQPGLSYSTASAQPRLWAQRRFAFQGA